jgi:hypothetical protein
MDMIEVAGKFRAPFLSDFGQGEMGGSLTDEWLDVSALLPPRIKTTHVQVIPRTLKYLRIYFREWAYRESRKQAETGLIFKQRANDILRNKSNADTKRREVRIKQLHPATGWPLMWNNFHKVIREVLLRL